MALAGDLGVVLEDETGGLAAHAFWFGEDQGRYVLAVPPLYLDDIMERADLLQLQPRRIGRVGGSQIALGDEAVALDKLRCSHEAWLPDYMAGYGD